MIKSIGSTKNKISMDENGWNVPRLQISEEVLAQCNIVNNNYRQDSIVSYVFIPSKSFVQ